MGATCDNEVQSWELMSGDGGSFFETEVSEIISGSHAETEQVKNGSWVCMSSTGGASSKNGQDEASAFSFSAPTAPTATPIPAPSPLEKRIDPHNGQAYTYNELYNEWKDKGPTDKEIKEYWNTCLSAAGFTSTATDTQ